MKTFAAAAAFLGTALAQNAAIGLPKAGQTVQPGQSLTVQVQRPNTITGSQEMAVAIGFQSCASGNCYAADEYMGTILYNGAFNPVYHEYYLPPYENFTVTVPASAAAGQAVIGVAHATLVGASAAPYLEVLNQTVTVA
ncbi:hypothetical protein ASPACDRAFT_1891584 [Aspergillus aculeatus ATCC 16872]|uniref:Uncharacterized protein n=1 Tax=Aspergillus aculeatus (strain ATCC 16872 / CBS 172.66 / WB 5094) TaxID=690307 RepID=A0A1L9WHZ2_ASPA1|nr:uncharacterized protein ASPACDRAFT_1891584 [Aspergillus aculeatus ATCC 16872]OJJ95763.1 hypothetical protein ASPACDRAFT_1891584 [Aspergillus aculeatus ATCC 16872]